MSSGGSGEQDFATGALRDFVKDWERAGKPRFAIGELLRYLGVEPPALMRPGYDEHDVFLGPGHREQLEDKHAAAERQRSLEKAARAVERGELDVPSPKELAAMRRPAVGGWHERLRATFEGGLEDGSWWIWHNGLATYGDGETYEKAKTGLLKEIAYALDEWKQLTDGFNAH